MPRVIILDTFPLSSTAKREPPPDTIHKNHKSKHEFLELANLFLKNNSDSEVR